MDVGKLAGKINGGFMNGGAVGFSEAEISYIRRLLDLLVKQYGLRKGGERKTARAFMTPGGEFMQYTEGFIYGIAEHFSGAVSRAGEAGRMEKLSAGELHAVAEILGVMARGGGLGFRVTGQGGEAGPGRRLIGYSAWIKANCEDECVGYATVKKYGDRARGRAEDMANVAADGSDDYWVRPVYADDVLYISDEYRNML